MFKYLFLKYIVLYFIFIIFFTILCHTVVNASDLVSSYHNESLSRESKIEQVKREEKKQENVKAENEIRNVNTSENNLVLPGLANNVTVVNKPSLVDDVFNSTASLPSWMLNIKEGALQRTGYVALGFMSIVVVFFIVRAVRLRQKRSKSRKYGIITSTVSDMEMEPLDKDDDEEEDTTLFDAQHKYSLQ